MSAAADDVAGRLEKLVSAAEADIELTLDEARNLRAAASLIRSQAARIEKLEEALKPFGREAGSWGREMADEIVIYIGTRATEPSQSRITVGHLRNARAALERT